MSPNPRTPAPVPALLQPEIGRTLLFWDALVGWDTRESTTVTPTPPIPCRTCGARSGEPCVNGCLADRNGITWNLSDDIREGYLSGVMAQLVYRTASATQQRIRKTPDISRALHVPCPTCSAPPAAFCPGVTPHSRRAESLVEFSRALQDFLDTPGWEPLA